MNTTLVIGLIALAVILVVIGYFLLRKALREQKPEIVKLDENPLDSMIEGYEEDPAQHEAECQQTACDIMEAGNIICEEANKPEPMVELEPTYTVTEELAGKVLAETPETLEVAKAEVPATPKVVEKETDKISDEDLKKIAKALKPVKKPTEKKRSRKETTNETKKKTEKTVKPGKSTPKKTKPRQNEAVNGKKNKKKPAKKNTKKK
jgi:hypothetical protein